MSFLPVIVFSAWSGTGKTTIIKQLIQVLKAKGLRVAAVKHDAHDFEIDREGKDSWRFSHAGADITVIQSRNKTALIEQRSLDLTDAINMIHDVDIILAEGYNDLPATPEIPSSEASRPDRSDKTSRPDRSVSAQDLSLPASNYRVYRIGISRSATGQGLRTSASDCIAIMTDDPSLTVPAETRVFALDDITGLGDYLTDYLQLPVS